MTEKVRRLLLVVCVCVVGNVASGQIWAQDAIPVGDDNDQIVSQNVNDWPMYNPYTKPLRSPKITALLVTSALSVIGPCTFVLHTS